MSVIINGLGAAGGGAPVAGGDWYYRALFELRPSPVFVPSPNGPAEWSLAYNEMTPAMALLGLPAIAAGMAAAYNLAKKGWFRT